MTRILPIFVLLAACGSDAPDKTDPSNTTTSTQTPTVTTTDTTTTSGTTTTSTGSQIWVPPPGTTWQWQLQGQIDTSVNVDVYDIDLFDVPQQVRDDLHAAGRIVICYFSAGSYEDWRPDTVDFLPADLGQQMDGWDEQWLDIRSTNVRTIMAARLDLAAAKGCDAVEPDNVDGYANATGFPLTRADQIDYNRYLATEAHSRGLSVGLKNAVDIAATLEPDFDWALNEECLDYNECGALQPFISAGKAVFHTEYVNNASAGPAMQTQVCGQPTIAGFSTLIKTWDLTVWYLDCP